MIFNLIVGAVLVASVKFELELSVIIMFMLTRASIWGEIVFATILMSSGFARFP